MGYFHLFNREPNVVTVSRVGANAGWVGYMTEKFYINDKCFSVIPNVVNANKINSKYLYYYLKQNESTLTSLQSEGGVPTINTQKVGSIDFPLPPLEIQSRIVEVLEKMTTLTAELEAELEARKQQYEYYRNKLLTFSEIGEGNRQVTWKKISEICVNCDNRRKPITSGKRIPGKYPYYGASGIVDYVEGYIFDGDYLLVSEDGANLLARNSPIAFSISGKNWVNNHAHVLSFETYAERKFVEYYLNMIDLSKYISSAAQPKLNQQNLNNMLIPIPPLSEQQRIVSILDRFEALTTDLQSGLPAEIEARRQQYEYYRDKLLTFEAV